MKKILLIILDGWGYSEEIEGNAILRARTPNMDRFYRQYPWSLLDASGEAVGLPSGQMGNSEVGHLNIGAGRVVYQELTRINRSIKTGEFFNNPVLLEAMHQANERNRKLHLMGLVSDGGVHSHFEHLKALLEMAAREKVARVNVHAILDGRDTVPFGAGPFLKELDQRCREIDNGCVATVCGRYYAMDRDRRWDRVKRAYLAYTKGDGLTAFDPLEALEKAYNRGEGDEFVQPTVIVNAAGQPRALIESEDSIIFFNFRPDRARQITSAFVDSDFKAFKRGQKPPLTHYVTMTRYDRNFKVPAAFTLDDLDETLGEIYARNNYAQIRIAETEKYAHVTFFFNGGREKPFPGEERILVPSPGVATYDLQPEMSAPEVSEKIIETILAGRHPLVVANFANADMVGHTGIMKAAVKAIETVDKALGAITAAALPRDWAVIICADHGNAEQMLDNEGSALTAHSENPVPFILLGDSKVRLRSKGILADVAPTILKLAGITTPPEMTGKSMLV